MKGVSSSIYSRIKARCFKSNPYASRFNNKGAETRGHSSKDDFAVHPAVRIHPMIKRGLDKNKNIKKLTELQESVYLSVLSGKDVTIHSPIGTGKTISYLLPIINNIYQIHDLLEELLLNDGTADGDESFKNLTLGWTRRLSHSLLPSNIGDYKQDLKQIESSGRAIFEDSIERNTTINKLIDVLSAYKPSELKKLCPHFPHLPYYIWKKKSKNAIYRTLMSNPLGNLRCVVVLAPNKDLVSQILADIHDIDYLGRCSVQTLTHTHFLPQETISNVADTPQDHAVPPQVISDVSEQTSQEGCNLFEGSGERFMQGECKNGAPVSHKVHPGVLPLEDVQKMLRDVPTGNNLRKQSYGIDGLVVKSVYHKRQPIITSSSIQWGSVDIVVTTPQLFLNDLMQRKGLNLYPVSIVFDEVDMLLENNAYRGYMMEIISYLRPRPKIYNPLINYYKLKPKDVPPCQFINIASTMMFSGLQTSGSMLYERFSTSQYISSHLNHLVDSKVSFVKVDKDMKMEALIKSILDNPVPRTVIFANSLETAKNIYKILKEHDWPVIAFHSKSTLATRIALIKTFYQRNYPVESTSPASLEEVNTPGNGYARILVSTDLLTRGIDLKDVQHIINYDFPNDSSTFLHRIKSKRAIVTSLIEDKNEDLSNQIMHFYRINKPINELLTRKRSFRRRYETFINSQARQPPMNVYRKEVKLSNNGAKSQRNDNGRDSSPSAGDTKEICDQSNLMYSSHPSFITGTTTIPGNEDVKYKRLSLKERSIQLASYYSPN